MNVKQVSVVNVDGKKKYFRNPVDAGFFIFSNRDIANYTCTSQSAVEINGTLFLLDKVEEQQDISVSGLPRDQIHNIYINVKEISDGGGSGFGASVYDTTLSTTNPYPITNMNDPYRTCTNSSTPVQVYRDRNGIPFYVGQECRFEPTEPEYAVLREKIEQAGLAAHNRMVADARKAQQFAMFSARQAEIRRLEGELNKLKQAAQADDPALAYECLHGPR